MKNKNTTLSEQFQNPIEKYRSVGTVPKSNRKMGHGCQIDTPIHKHIIGHFSGLVLAL